MSKSFAETAMEMAGKSKEEILTTGQVDAADDDVEKMFEERYKTVNSPVHRAVWENLSEAEYLNLFDSGPVVSNPRVHSLLKSSSTVSFESFNILQKHYENNTLLDENGKHNPEMLKELAAAGFFGVLIEHGNKPKMEFKDFIRFLARNATVSAQVAGLSSVHSCIGAVDPVMTFGTQEQKDKFLPRLAAGVPSGFALTEPNAGSDLTALKTTAKLIDGQYIVNGTKVFITNAQHGGIIGLVCKCWDTGKPIVLIVDLPKENNDNFRIEKYGLYALAEMQNVRLIFDNFKVPAENLIQEDGLAVAYHGLNYGRTAVCANANGVLRRLLVSLFPWVNFRETYGQKIVERELVQKRIATLAGYVCGTAALMNWAAHLLDEGYRGEMECIIAKIAGSEWQKDAAIELVMKTHGGRSFLHGHLFGDNIHDLLAPCIYEGEGEMLSLAFFKSLVKNHGKTYYEKMGKAVGKPTLGNIVKAVFKNPRAFTPYLVWKVKNLVSSFVPVPKFKELRSDLMKRHIIYAVKGLKVLSKEIDSAMNKHQLKLADRQCRMLFLSQKTQDLTSILVTALYGNKVGGIMEECAHVRCLELKNKIEGTKLEDYDFKFMTKLGERIAKGNQFDLDVKSDQILFPY